jgi:hypothetical protein
MQQDVTARHILGDTTLQNGKKAADALEDGSIFAIRINDEGKQVTYSYLDGNEAREETLRLKHAYLLTSTLRREKNFVACGDVFIRPDMVTSFKPVDDKANVVHWNQSHHPYTSDLTFTVLDGKAQFTIRGIQNGVARPFTRAGYYVIPRGVTKPFFVVQKADEGVRPRLFDNPERPARNYIPLGSGEQVPRQYVCV